MTVREGIVKDFLNRAVPVNTPEWQGKPNDKTMYEVLHFSCNYDMGKTVEEATSIFNPKLPWADIHFEERVGGIPLNPPPSHKLWASSTEDFFEGSNKFSHSYPERMWSKRLHIGIRYDIADLSTLISVLRRDISTRQAYLPIFFPEDLTASLKGDRVPCTMGWHFIVRNGVMDLFYPMRSCDIFRHLNNDLYLANRLVLYVIEKLGRDDIVPGKLVFQATSLHCFESDIELYKKGLIK